MEGPPPDPPDDALIVRGGEAKYAEQLRSQAEANLRDYGSRSLSVFTYPGLDLEGIVREARSYGRYLPHGQMSIASAGSLRGLGLGLEYTPPPPGRYSLMIPDDATDELYRAPVDVLDNVETPQGRMPNVPPAN
jgi:hypothetical protein